jgi:hypothetical protein
MSVLDLETSRDLRRVERALKRREKMLGNSETIVMAKNDITEQDRSLFGTPVRYEVDVCIPLTDLKRDLNEVRLHLAECIKILEDGGTAHDRRFAVHRRLSRIRATLHLRKKERTIKGLGDLLREQSE